MLEERTAVLETQVKRNEKDLASLFVLFRKLMKQGEVNEKEILEKLNAMSNKMDNQKSFWAGMVFAFTGIGALIGSAIVYLKG